MKIDDFNSYIVFKNSKFSFFKEFQFIKKSLYAQSHKIIIRGQLRNKEEVFIPI